MDEKQFLIPPQKILKAVERRRPIKQLTELTALVGEDGAAAIMMAFSELDAATDPDISFSNFIPYAELGIMVTH